MKTLIAVMLLMGCVACGPSEEEKQHHLYNIEQCKRLAKANVFVTDFKADPSSPTVTKQSLYSEIIVECMVEAEHTTREFQQEKHDSYGKVD